MSNGRLLCRRMYMIVCDGKNAGNIQIDVSGNIGCNQNLNQKCLEPFLLSSRSYSSNGQSFSRSSSINVNGNTTNIKRNRLCSYTCYAACNYYSNKKQFVNNNIRTSSSSSSNRYSNIISGICKDSSTPILFNHNLQHNLCGNLIGTTRNFSTTGFVLQNSNNGNHSTNISNVTTANNSGDTSTVEDDFDYNHVPDLINQNLLIETPPVIDPATATFADIGLGGWTPPGLVQSGLEYLHFTLGIEWWTCIVLGTIMIRTAVLPLVIKFQKEISVVNNSMPEMQVLQMKMTNARQSGNVIEAEYYGNRLVEFVKERKINPLKSIALPLIQLPFFLSFFFGLRGMADVPVYSLHTGGMLWFPDLTIPDPFYILPVMTCLTSLLTIEISLRHQSVGVAAQEMQYVKYMMRLLPVAMFPFFINFPGLLLVYWFTTNTYTVIQSLVLRSQPVKNFLGFERPITTNQSILEALQKDLQKRNEQKTFREGFRESFNNMNISHKAMEKKKFEIEEKEQLLKRNPVKKG